MPAAQRKSAPPPERVTQPLSIGGLAARLGVPRQRIYALVDKKQIRAVPMAGGLVITARGGEPGDRRRHSRRHPRRALAPRFQFHLTDEGGLLPAAGARPTASV